MAKRLTLATRASRSDGPHEVRIAPFTDNKKPPEKRWAIIGSFLPEQVLRSGKRKLLWEKNRTVHAQRGVYSFSDADLPAITKSLKATGVSVVDLCSGDRTAPAQRNRDCEDIKRALFAVTKARQALEMAHQELQRAVDKATGGRG